MWSGFDLRPRNLFDRTPFYPYSPAPPARPGANARPNADPQDGTGQADRAGGDERPLATMNRNQPRQADPDGQPACEQGDADILRQGHAGEDGGLVAPHRFERPACQRVSDHEHGHHFAGGPAAGEIRQQQAEQGKPGERRIDLRGMHRQRMASPTAKSSRHRPGEPRRATRPGKQTAQGWSHTAP